MKPILYQIASCLLFVTFVDVAQGEIRTWTDSTGLKTIEAEYVRADGKSVRLKLANGKKLTVRLSQLSDGDQQFVRDALAVKPAETAAVKTDSAESDATSNSATKPPTGDGSGSTPSFNSEWVSLIDSSSFDKWKKTGTSGTFELLPDGAVRGSVGQGYLVSPNAYVDFELAGRMKVSSGGNGGVFFGVPKGSKFDNPRGYEVQLYVRKAGDNNGTGSVWREGGLYRAFDARFETPDKWYSFSIRNQRGSILIKIDDQTVFEESNTGRRAGHIAFQTYSQAGEVQYADLKIRELSPPQGKSATSDLFAVCGIRTGMTFEQTIPILRARGMTIQSPRQSDSLLRHTALYSMPSYKHANKLFVSSVRAGRQDGPIRTSIALTFCEDLPDRPGVGVCYEVWFCKQYVGTGSPDLMSWFREARDELVERHGAPAHESEKSIIFGDGASEELDASFGSDLVIRLESREIHHRSAQGFEYLEEKLRPTAPELKIDF